MDSSAAPGPVNQNIDTPEPETLQPRNNEVSDNPPLSAPTPDPKKPKTAKWLRSRNFRPSHKATFVGLSVVVLILAVLGVILGFVLRGKQNSNNSAGNVTISPAVLSKIGVNRSNVGNSGAQLTIDPNTQFNGTVTVAGSTRISGQLQLNSKFSASDANLTQLEAGNTALGQLNVNGSSTLSSLNLRNTLTVTGATQLQGAVTLNQLLTVDNSVNVVGNLSIGGILSTNTFSARSLTSTSTLTIGGHVITSGQNPVIAPAGGSLGSNGTVSISGNDSAGIIAVNIGAGGGGNGVLANIAFKTQYGAAPRVVITPIGFGARFYVTNVSVGGFSVGVNDALPNGSFSIDYIVEQ